jgi:hypothetical protein
MNTILIIIAVLIVISVIAYFAIPKFRKWILGLLAGLGFITGVVVTPEIPTDPIDDSIEIPIDTTDATDDVVIVDTIPEQPKDTIIVKPVPEPVDSDNDGFVDEIDECPGEFGSDNGCPEITFKEITETKEIPFISKTTNIEGEARTGQKGVLTITYKLTFKEGKQIAKEKLSEKVTKQPRSEIAYVEPEPEPSDVNIVNLDIPEGQDAITRYLRGEFKQDSTIYKFPKGEFFTYGILPEDEHRVYEWSSSYKDKNGKEIAFDTTYTITQGKHGIVKIEGLKNIHVLGNNTTLYNDLPAIWDGDMNGDGISEPGWVRDGSHMSHRKFFRVNNSKYIKLSDIDVRSGNLTPVHKNNRPEYDSAFEFEHLAHIQSTDYLVIEDVTGTGLWGDGVYLRDSDDVYLRNITIDWNGRQGGATISGNRVYIENYNVLNSRRSGWDIEGNEPSEVAENFVVTYSNFNTHLYGLPMGGPGYVKNVLSINNEYSGTPVYSRGDGNTRIRENIIFANSKARSGGTYLYTNGVLIDGIDITQDDGNDEILNFKNSTNITIRNLKRIVELKRGKDIFIIDIRGTTTSKDFKIYGNDKPVYFRYADGTLEKAKEYNATEKEKISIPFETSEWLEMHWERLYLNGKGWRDEDYEDDGWRPEWYNKIIKNDE